MVDTTSTVKFDVGGTVYRVSRSLINSYPDTMLAKIISPVWNHNNHNKDDNQNNNEPIFIDRNGNSFQYILDYMRDGIIDTMVCSILSREILFNEFIYYGFDSNDIKDLIFKDDDIKKDKNDVSSDVITTSILTTTANSSTNTDVTPVVILPSDIANIVHSIHEKHHNELIRIKKHINTCSIEMKLHKLIYKCYTHYMTNHTNHFTIRGNIYNSIYGGYSTHDTYYDYITSYNIPSIDYIQSNITKCIGDIYGFYYISMFWNGQYNSNAYIHFQFHNQNNDQLQSNPQQSQSQQQS